MVRILEESVSTMQVEDAALPACYQTSHLPVHQSIGLGGILHSGNKRN